MSAWGTIGWGVSSWGGSSPLEQAIPIPEGEVASGHELGTPSGLGKTVPDVYTITEFEQGVFFGSPDITNSHVRAYVQSFADRNPHQSGSPAAFEIALKAKSWAPVGVAFTRTLISGILDLVATIRAKASSSSGITGSIFSFGAILTGDPVDLPASIVGFFLFDLLGHLRAQFIGQLDLSATLQPYHLSDLTAILRPTHFESLAAILEANPGADIAALVQTIPGENLGAIMCPIPGADLGAAGGGHFPVDIGALVCSVPPEDIGAFLRRGDTGTIDLSTSLTQVGVFEGMAAFVKVFLSSQEDLGVNIRVIARSSGNLIAKLFPIHLQDLFASIITQRVYSVRAIIYGYCRESVSNMSAILRKAASGISDLTVSPIKAVVSTHTSGKLPNLDKVSRSFFNNRYVFGSVGSGFSILTLEPVFGVFPDLHAEIFARDFFRDNIRAFIRSASRQTTNLTTQMVAVTPFININKVLLSLVPLFNLPGDIIQVGGFLPVRASITPLRSSSTGTADDAGFITTATSYKFYLGTGGGLFIPPQIVAEVRLSTYSNNFSLPDLHAILEGWHVTDMGASIKEYPFSVLTATLSALDLNHLKEISASITSFKVVSLGATLVSTGGFEALSAEIIVAGGISGLSGVLVPYLNPLAFNVVSVSTVPISDMGAIINYGSLVRCAPTSTSTIISAYIKVLITGTPETIQSLGASLNSLRIVLDLGATIIGRKRTRISVVGLSFRANTRQSVPLSATLTPLAIISAGLSATISGLLHEENLPASLTPVRIFLPATSFTKTEVITNLKTGEVKNILLSFRTQVSSYVYDEIASAVFATDKGTWALDLRSLITDDSLFDRSPDNREHVVSDVQEFFSLDEAIRSAIVILCDRRQNNMAATIIARGSIKDLGVNIGIIDGNRLLDLITQLVAVATSPDIGAIINVDAARSSLFPMRATIISNNLRIEGDLSSSIVGNIDRDLGAQIISM